jgi:hypothetical protein
MENFVFFELWAKFLNIISMSVQKRQCTACVVTLGSRDTPDGFDAIYNPLRMTHLSTKLHLASYNRIYRNGAVPMKRQLSALCEQS